MTAVVHGGLKDIDTALARAAATGAADALGDLYQRHSQESLCTLFAYDSRCLSRRRLNPGGLYPATEEDRIVSWRKSLHYLAAQAHGEQGLNVLASHKAPEGGCIGSARYDPNEWHRKRQIHRRLGGGGQHCLGCGRGSVAPWVPSGFPFVQRGGLQARRNRKHLRLFGGKL